MTVGYLAAWLAGLGVAAIAVAMVEDTGSWEDLGAAILGFLAGALIGHIAWAVLVARMLRPFGRTGRLVAVILLTPVIVIALAGGLASIFPFSIVPMCAVPAALTWWAAEPRPSDP